MVGAQSCPFTTRQTREQRKGKVSVQLASSFQSLALDPSPWDVISHAQGEGGAGAGTLSSSAKLLWKCP